VWVDMTLSASAVEQECTRTSGGWNINGRGRSRPADRPACSIAPVAIVRVSTKYPDRLPALSPSHEMACAASPVVATTGPAAVSVARRCGLRCRPTGAASHGQRPSSYATSNCLVVGGGASRSAASALAAAPRQAAAAASATEDGDDDEEDLQSSPPPAAPPSLAEQWTVRRAVARDLEAVVAMAACSGVEWSAAQIAEELNKDISSVLVAVPRVDFGGGVAVAGGGVVHGVGGGSEGSVSSGGGDCDDRGEGGVGGGGGSDSGVGAGGVDVGGNSDGGVGVGGGVSAGGNASNVLSLPVGGMAVAWVVADEVQILEVAVHPTLRRNGLGSRLVRAALDVCPTGDATLEVGPGGPCSPRHQMPCN